MPDQPYQPLIEELRNFSQAFGALGCDHPRHIGPLALAASPLTECKLSDQVTERTW